MVYAQTRIHLARSAGAAEFTDSISTEGKTSPTNVFI